MIYILYLIISLTENEAMMSEANVRRYHKQYDLKNILYSTCDRIIFL